MIDTYYLFPYQELKLFIQIEGRKIKRNIQIFFQGISDQLYWGGFIQIIFCETFTHMHITRSIHIYFSFQNLKRLSNSEGKDTKRTFKLIN